MVKKTEKSTEKPIEKISLEPEGFNSSKIKFNDIQPTGSTQTMEGISEPDNNTSDNVQPKRRGRPSKAKQESETQEQVLKITEDIFTPIFNLINKILVTRYSPVVKLSDDEITSLKFYLALVSNKYLPSVIQKFGAEFTLGILTFTIVADKTIKYQEWKQRQDKTVLQEKQSVE